MNYNTKFSDEEQIRLEELFKEEIKNHSVILNPKKEIYINVKDIDVLAEYNKEELYNMIKDFEKKYKYKINIIDNVYDLAVKILHLQKDPYYYYNSFLLKPVYRYDYLYEVNQYTFIDKQFGYIFFNGRTPTKKTIKHFEELLIKNGNMSKAHCLTDIH